MRIMSLIQLYGLMTAVFFAIDLTWIGLFARGFYQRNLGHLLAENVNWGAALIFYMIYIVGILVFAVMPGLAAASLARTIGMGAFLGLFAYATFDLTSMALFRDFPLAVVIVDLAWGTALTAAVAAAGYGIGRWIGIG
jgi:uncharacterized membrane protein